VSRGPGRIEDRLVPLTGIDHEALRAELIAEIQAMLGPAMRVEMQFRDALPPAPHGKHVKVRDERAPTEQTRQP
jgi:hypothetical protein